MYRVYKEMLEQFLVILIYFHQRASYNDAHEYVQKEVYRPHYPVRGMSDKTSALIHSALTTFMGTRKDMYESGDVLERLIATISKQLLNTKEHNDRELIDAIVQALGLPYVRNVLAAKTLSRLREMLLVPDELIDVKAMLKKAAYCAKCGHEFENGEMASVETDVAHDRSFVCTRCARPQSIACDINSKRSVRISDIKGLGAILKRPHEAPPQLEKEEEVLEGQRQNMMMLEEILDNPMIANVGIPEPMFIADRAREWIIPAAPGRRQVHVNNVMPMANGAEIRFVYDPAVPEVLDEP